MSFGPLLELQRQLFHTLIYLVFIQKKVRSAQKFLEPKFQIFRYREKIVLLRRECITTADWILTDVFLNVFAFLIEVKTIYKT